MLRDRREALDIKQERMAEMLGVAQSYVSTYEKAGKRLDLFQMKRIAAGLDSTRGSLLIEFEHRVAHAHDIQCADPPEELSDAERAAAELILEPVDAGDAEDAARLGAILRAFRKAAPKRSQESIAKSMGKSQSWVSKYEKGKIRIDVIELDDLVVELGTTLHVIDALLEEMGA